MYDVGSGFIKTRLEDVIPLTILVVVVNPFQSETDIVIWVVSKAPVFIFQDIPSHTQLDPSYVYICPIVGPLGKLIAIITPPFYYITYSLKI
jgi:hypothetical protein